MATIDQTEFTPAEEAELLVHGIKTDMLELCLKASVDRSILRPVATDLILLRSKLSELIASAYEREAA